MEFESANKKARNSFQTEQKIYFLKSKCLICITKLYEKKKLMYEIITLKKHNISSLYSIDLYKG